MTLLHSAQALASAPSSFPLNTSLLGSEASDDPTPLSALPSIHPEEVPPCPIIRDIGPLADTDPMLLRIDPKVILSCITRLNTLISHSTDTKRGANGLRRSHGLFEVDGNRRNDFYLFPEAGGGPRAHLYQPFLISAKFNDSTTLSHAAVLCPERDAVLCHLADLVSEYFGLDGMVAVLLQVVYEGADTLCPLIMTGLTDQLSSLPL